MKTVIRFAPVLFSILLFASCNNTELQQPVYEYALTSPADTGSRYPYLHQDEEGKIYMSWLMGIEEDMYALQYSTYSEGQWTMPGTVKVGTNFFTNWADFPSVIGFEGEPMAAHWLRKVEGGPYAYHVQVSFPQEGSLRWAEPITPHLDDTATEHGFVTIRPIDEDRVLAIWLDGRDTEGRAADEYEDMNKSMTLRSAEVTRSGEILRSRIIDDSVCDCCQTDLVKTENGFLAVYRDRTEDEIRDIYISRYNLETGEWGEPMAVHNDNWRIGACPVNGPKVVADGDRVAVAWFTMEGNESRTYLIRSDNGGETFGEPIQIGGDRSMGRVNLALLENGSIYVSWLRHRGEVGDVMVTEIDSAGNIKESVLVGLTSPSRNSGFPQMKATDDGLFFAWTQTAPLIRVRTALVPFDAFDIPEL
ncbi:sialidase family protein [Rhodohalobacter halophilus]|uniref:sialidase family protein n=1 Tax=Rhodohalobacter halophilus TaxID=1812810 RepID=UPI00083FCE94|nr:sialidase family protein [Rhodohalobacter halophilus]